MPEVASRLNCSIATAYALIEKRTLSHYRCPGVRVSEDQLEEYLEKTKREREEATPDKRSRSRPRTELKHLR
ncbi:MAG: helix-turn-helix domain-containing protein [Pirellulaceae bacterium]